MWIHSIKQFTWNLSKTWKSMVFSHSSLDQQSRRILVCRGRDATGVSVVLLWPTLLTTFQNGSWNLILISQVTEVPNQIRRKFNLKIACSVQGIYHIKFVLHPNFALVWSRLFPFFINRYEKFQVKRW